MSQRIQKPDPNFRAATQQGGLVYQPLEAFQGPVVDGLFPGSFCRMDPDALPVMSEGVQALAWHTAGAAIRFRVPGGRFGVRMELREGGDMSHMPRSGIGGLAVYFGTGRDRTFHSCFRPEGPGVREVSGEVQLPLDEVTLYLPLYDGVTRLELGFPPGVLPQAPAPYRLEQPVVFYGSSITQGGCASHPGNCYSSMISRMLDCKTWNLGFSGNARGEPEMAAYLAGLSMSALVLDYDHNAPTVEHLAKTHLPLLQRVWEQQPHLPVVLVSKPNPWQGDEAENRQRRDIILRSYLWGREQGRTVEFVDGATLFDGPFARDCTVDGCHPNDLGFSRMALKIAPAISRVLNL